MNSTIPIIPFGPDETCTLDLCPIEYSIFRYRPSLAANATFIALHFVLLLIHLVLGLRLKNWFYSGATMIGCASNIIGYGARVLLWQNPFSFAGFLLQIIFVGSAPVYYSAAIYVTFTRTVEKLDASLSRIKPKLYYIVFITSDFTSLVLQAVGGALSSVSNGTNAIGVDLALAGLIFQVVTMLLFVGLLADYLIRYFYDKPLNFVNIRLRVFRVAELSEGYSGTLFHNEPLFIGLEGLLIVLAVIALCFGHPGFVFDIDKANLVKTYPDSSLNGGIESGVELVEK